MDTSFNFTNNTEELIANKERYLKEDNSGPLSILIVDDEKTFFETSVSTFEKKQFEKRAIQFFHANSIDNALKIFKKTLNFEIIILSMLIGTKNSYLKLIEYLRVDLNNKFTRIILLKDNDDDSLSEEFLLKHDINHYLSKNDPNPKWPYLTIISALKAYNNQLEIGIQKEKLYENSIFINNILNKLSDEKRKFEENLALNIEKSISPILRKINKFKIIDKGIIELLENSLKNLSSDFYKKVTKLNYNLTPTEIKVCELIKSGYLGKEIAEVMCISFSTVESHKRNIRRKLGISNTPTNLRMFLTKL